MMPKIGEALESGPVTGRGRGRGGEFDKVVLGGTRGGPEEPTLRQDRWWLQPVVTSSSSPHSSATRPGRRSRTPTTSSAPAGSRPDQALLLTVHRWPLRARARGRVHLSWWLSPAILILIFPLGFRFTCYYYRRSYYRSFWWSPPACAVADAAPQVHGRDPVPADPPEPPPLLLLRRPRLQRAPDRSTPSSPSASRASGGASASARSCCA